MKNNGQPQGVAPTLGHWTFSDRFSLLSQLYELYAPNEPYKLSDSGLLAADPEFLRCV